MRLLSPALLALLAGCLGQSQTSGASKSAVCRQPEIDPAIINRTSDPAVTHGLLFRLDSVYEFSPCDNGAIYLVDGSFAILDELDQYFSTLSAGWMDPIYVRFHGLEIECERGLPERYTNAVLILDLITRSHSVPLNCT